MSIFDAFTGRPARDAASSTRALLKQTQDDLLTRMLDTKAESAGYFNRGFDSARDNFRGYGAAATDAVDRGVGNAWQQLDRGEERARAALEGARDDLAAGYRPLTDVAGEFRAGSKLYADALGVNGQEGVDRAKAAFFAGPGYTSNLDAAIDALNRRRNAAGALVSGNADADAIKLGSDHAANTWNTWLAGLSPYNNLSLSAASGIADSGKSLANLGVTEAGMLNSTGQGKASVATEQGRSLADIARTYYGGLAGLDTSEGAALAGNASNAANVLNSAALSIAPQIGQTYKDDAAAAMAGSKAFWDALMGGANLAAKASGVGGFAPSGKAQGL